MSVIIDKNAGFCFGVVKAIAAAEEQLKLSHKLYCLGDIVHNNEEVQRLSRMGLVVIDHSQLDNLPQSTVLIRAHGEPPSTYKHAADRGIKLIDATCPIVLALQKRVRDGYEEMLSCNGQVVIFGKQGHAEVIGLNGQTNNTAIIISSPDAIDTIDFKRPIRLFSQTTMSKEDYNRLIDNIQARVPQSGYNSKSFVAYNTICSRMANRAKELKAFSQSVELLIFVSGVNSSNGHYLYEYCRLVQPNTILISSYKELHMNDIRHYNTIGITGATSTPWWLMEQIKRNIECI